MEEVSGSIPDSSTPPVLLIESFERAAASLGGFIAGEGCFCIRERPERFVNDGSARLRFEFVIEVADHDEAMILALSSMLGTGRVFRRLARQPGWRPSVGLSIGSFSDHQRTTIPFMDRFLRPSAKRVQYEHWRDSLTDYLTRRPTQYGGGPSICSVPGCTGPVRGRGLCRRHYYRATGH